MSWDKIFIESTKGKDPELIVEVPDYVLCVGTWD